MKRILILLLLVGPTLSAAAGSSSMKEVPKDVSDSNLEALVLAVHLTRPEVIDSCLKEIKASKYEFIWTSLDTEESRDPINITFKLTASLVDREKQSHTNQIAIMTLVRDVEKLRSGSLVFKCHISYDTRPD